MSDDRTAHWDTVYQTKSDDQVSWTEAEPALSLALLDAAGCRPEHAVIDVGGGASRLVDSLLARGQAHVAVLDLAAAALGRSRLRVGPEADVDWIVADITTWRPTRRYDVWHDRAVLHFLIAPADQHAYRAALDAALAPGGTAIIGTFALDGPEKCSGLPVMRHDGASLAALLGPGFDLVATRLQDHATPWGAIQSFHFASFRKR